MTKLSGRCERSVVRSSVIAVGEIILLLVAAQVLERQHDDGQARARWRAYRRREAAMKRGA